MTTTMTSSNNIPLIDLRESAENPKDLIKKKLREACEEWGCFRVKNHGIDSSLMEEMKKVVRCLLDLPLEIKMRNTEQVIAGSGYMPPSSVNPLYEGFGLYDMASSHAVQSFCSQLDSSPHQTKRPKHPSSSKSLFSSLPERVSVCDAKLCSLGLRSLIHTVNEGLVGPREIDVSGDSTHSRQLRVEHLKEKTETLVAVTEVRIQISKDKAPVICK